MRTAQDKSYSAGIITCGMADLQRGDSAPMKARQSMSTITPGARSDVDIQRDVLDELRWDSQVTVSDIGVSVTEGVVTLTGLVENYLERMAAQAVALRVEGVHAVANDIEVRLHASAERTDSDLALAALYALKWDADIQPDTLDVAVSHGYVTLKGVVEQPAQRDAAERVLRRLAGVRGVTNWITVTSRPAPDDIRGRIKSALGPDSDPESQFIVVETHGRAVTLRGTVRSFQEKHTVEQAAMSAPGVVSVTNKIEVVRDE